jgi:hypothetical protein
VQKNIYIKTIKKTKINLLIPESAEIAMIKEINIIML